MQNTQNNFTVENLIAKYRSYVKENCPKHWEYDGVKEFLAPDSVEKADADEQLIATLYKKVAGISADERITGILSKYSEVYYDGVLTEEEMSFLCSNFEEAVDVTFSHIEENDIFLLRRALHRKDRRIIDFVKEHLEIKKESSVFIADLGYGRIASLFRDCKVKGFASHDFYADNEEIWALLQIRLYSQGIYSNVLKTQKGCTETSYLEDVECVIWGELPYDELKTIYERIRPGSRMILFFDKYDAARVKEGTDEIRKMVVEDLSVESIISFEYKDMLLDTDGEMIVLLIEKSAHDIVHIENGITGDSFDILSEALDYEILWPSFYSTQRPTKGIPLSDIATFIDWDERLIKRQDRLWALIDLDVHGLKGQERFLRELDQVPLVVPAKMAKEYRDANIITQDWDKAGSINDDLKHWVRAIPEPCVLLYGNSKKTVVGYISDLPEKGMATVDTVVCIVPRNGIDVRYLAALLLSPEVKSQMESICQKTINDRTFPLIMDKIIVPNHSNNERLAFLLEVNHEALQASRKEMEQEHKNYTRAVRMRKHALTQSLSSVEAMFYALNECRIRQNGSLLDGDVISRIQGTTVNDAFEFLSKEIKNIMPVLEHVADVEYSFSKPESIDPEEFIECYIEKEEKNWLNFKPVVLWKKGNNRAKQDIKNEKGLVCEMGKALNKFEFPKDALERLMLLPMNIGMTIS